MKPEPQGVKSKAGIGSTTVVHQPGELPVGMHLPKNDHHFIPYVAMGDYQGQTYAKMLDLLPERNIVLDIGAHVGFWSKKMAADFAQVLSFEPVPTNFECLTKNVTAANALLFNYGIGYWGVREMYLHKSDNSGSWSTEIFDGDVESGKAPFIPLDCIKVNGRVSAIKLDVQGMETGTAMLEQHKPLVCVEVKSKGKVDGRIQYFLERRGAKLLDRVGKDLFMGWPT
jgi:FkbM family methyltransferase